MSQLNTKPVPLHPIVPQPSFTGFVSALFTGSPLLPASIYTWVGFVREVALFILLDAVSFVYSLIGPGAPKASTGFIVLAVALQVLYIVVNLIWRILRAIKSPLAPLFAFGDTFVENLIMQHGGSLPDISNEPGLPPVEVPFAPLAPGEPRPIVLGPIAGNAPESSAKIIPMPLIPGDTTPTPPPPVPPTIA